jgi:hypothetical protein
MEAIEDRVASGDTSPCVGALESLAREAAAAERELGAASIPALAAAIVDLEILGNRLDRLGETTPDLHVAATTAATSLRTLASGWTRHQAHLGAARETTWLARMVPADHEQALARLPERMGSEALEALLRDEEASAQPVRSIIEQLGRVIARLRVMDAKLGPTVEQAREPVSVQRCELAWTRVQTWAEQSDVSPPDPPTCAVIVQRLDGEAQTDAALLVEVIRRTWVDPWAAKHRRETGHGVALIDGRIASVSHRLASSIVATSAIGDPAGARAALEQARHAACLAATALWIHAQIDDDARLGVLLETDCAQQAPDAWIEEAIARPRRSLQGVGLAFIEPGPAALAALERYPWAPLGLVHVLADPQVIAPSPSPLRIEYEELAP